MRNAGFMHKDCSILILCILAGIFVSSCGLEEIITVQEPTVVHNAPLYSSSDSLTWYFSFETSPDSDAIGTDVYYKIYNDSSKLSSERSSILSVNTSTNSTEAAKRMIDTYGYQPLGSNPSTSNSVYFPEKKRSVVFRLKNYAHADSSSYNVQDRYKSHACVGLKSGTEYEFTGYIPFRNGNRKSFDFFDDNDDDKNRTRDALPVYGDSDYSCTESDKDKSFDEYFVQIFAVGVALNLETVTASYSLVLDLGSVPIKKDE